MPTQISLMKAVRQHMLLSGETMAEFSAGWKKLTDQDKVELAAQFEREFDYSITRSEK